MNWQLIIEHAIALLFPLIVIFLFVYYMLKSFFDQFEKQRKQEIRVKFSEETLPLRLQAYERLVLFLERIKPESLILRTAQTGMTTAGLQRAMSENIREEFEHNLSQQIYITAEAWAMVVAARQSMIQLISSMADDIQPEAPYMEYATELLGEFAQSDDDPIRTAILFIQQEARELM
ncbi:MAG: hypothetical protein JXR22_09050 [Prolixibacteraceae bacterium]|nr:hypothetical protein [Prolixibacteraceae bacterium]